MQQMKKRPRDAAEFDTGNIDRIEHDIAPPMRAAVTIPVSGDLQNLGVAVYVAQSPFAQAPPADSYLIAIGKQVSASADLVRAAIAAWHLCRSHLACPGGPTPELFEEVAEASKVALQKAGVKL